MSNNNLPHEGVLFCGPNDESRDTEDPIYGDIEVEDFNKLWNDTQLIEDKFGETLSVKIKVDKKNGQMTREVKEDLTKTNKTDSPKKAAASASTYDGESLDKRISEENKQSLLCLNEQLRNLEKSFNKTAAEVCEVYTMVSGDLGKVRQFYENRRPVLTWNVLEDMALVEPEKSPEFQVLLAEKGWAEILKRRKFLQCIPIYEQEIRAVQDDEYE